MTELTRAKREADRRFLRKKLGEEYLRDKIIDWDTLSGSLRVIIRDIRQRGRD